MIHTNRTVTVGNQESIIDSPIILYRGDREVEVEFTLNGNKFTFTKYGDVIRSTNATHGQLVINTPTGENMFSEVTECHEGKVVFLITKEMIDELVEIGFYSFQIRLFDENQVSRVTIPPVFQGIEIRNPIAAEDETNVVDIGLVDYAIVQKDEYENLATFLPDGSYNKTDWESRGLITEAKLDKIEDALYTINENMEASDLSIFNRIESINQNVNRRITEFTDEADAEFEAFERSVNTNIEQFKIDTNVAMSVHRSDTDDAIAAHISDTDAKLALKVNLHHVQVEDFGALGDYDDDTDTGTDDTQAIQDAINYAWANGISTVVFGNKGYVIKGQITIKEGVTLLGTRESFTQGLSTHEDFGSNRYRIMSETSLMIMPDDISVTPLVFERQSGIKNLSIIQYQNFAATSEDEIIPYAPTIKGVHGFNAYNIRFIGAYEFIEVGGESIHIEKIYGWALKTGIRITTSADICRIKDIHLNSNVTRPSIDFINLAKSRNGIALEMTDCDGILIENFFCIFYKTGIKSYGNNTSVGLNQFSISNFFMDFVGVAFDFDLDCGWASNINNGVVIYGFTDDPAHGGFIQLNKSQGTTIQTPINISNISANRMTGYLSIAATVPDYFINFKYLYGFNIQFNNIVYDKGTTNLMSTTRSYVSGQIRTGDTLYDLLELTRVNNYLPNPRLDDIVDNVPVGWIATITPTSCVVGENGNVVITGGSIYYRKKFSSATNVNLVGYVENYTGDTTVITLTGWSSDWSQSWQDKAVIDNMGYFRVKSKYAYPMFDVAIKAPDGSITIKKIEAFKGDKAY